MSRADSRGGGGDNGYAHTVDLSSCFLVVINTWDSAVAMYTDPDQIKLHNLESGPLGHFL